MCVCAHMLWVMKSAESWRNHLKHASDIQPLYSLSKQPLLHFQRLHTPKGQAALLLYMLPKLKETGVSWHAEKLLSFYHVNETSQSEGWRWWWELKR